MTTQITPGPEVSALANAFYVLAREAGTHPRTAFKKAVESGHATAEVLSRTMPETGDASVLFVYSKLRGVANRQDVVSELDNGTELFLDVWNDGSIVAIHRGRIVGSIGRQHTAWLRELMNTRVGVACTVHAVTGGTEDKPTRGVNILLQVSGAITEAMNERGRVLEALHTELMREASDMPTRQI